uniref:Toll-like receptor 7 n=1 Tax=Sebastes schlegelii TaxID=214486 RepID=A0A8F5H4D7_SEBSC|nr:toll-like receptor 7 [Sebastes schlegelii]
MCVALLGLSISSASVSYPKTLPCDVSETSNGSTVTVDCTERSLKDIPRGIPRDTTNLTLTINHIPKFNSTSFRGLENLTEIDMRCNCVPIKIGPKDRMCTKSVVIEDNTFTSLRNLRALYLDGNQLNSIPKGLPPNLILLSLEVNHIYKISKANLSEIRNIEILYLSQNCYYRNPCNVSYDIEDGAFAQLNNLTLLSLKSNNLSFIPHRLPTSLKELYLYNNNIQEVTDEDFKNLTNLEILDISGNCPRCYNAPFPCDPCPNNSPLKISAKAFKMLTKLKTLRLHSNSLTCVPAEWFASTTELRVLDLSSNFLAREIGVTHFPKFLGKLEELDLSFNYELQRYPESLRLSCSFSSLKSLRILRLKGFVFQQLKPESIAPLKPLTNLEVVDLGTNFIKMTNLSILMELKSFKIIILDLSGNSLTTVPPMLSICTKSLKKLLLHKNQILKLTPDFLKDAYNLKYLDLSYNHIQHIEKSSFPDDVVNQMDMLLLHKNRFVCSCNATWFITWLNRTTVTIPRLATDVTCASPGAQRGHPVISVDLLACQHSYLSIILYTLMTSLVLSFLTLSISSHLFLWDVWYIYHFCRAKLKGYSRLHSHSSAYDAFVIYDKEDPAVTEWVMKEMCTHLEEHGDRPLTLCLEERDWLPGCPLIDNLSQSIHNSKRTMFILTSKYIKSGNFKMAFYLAHQRLMDEKNDVIILIFMEKVPCDSKYLRLRKRLYKRSVLEWPTNPQAQLYFWFSLRSVLATESHKQYNNLFKETL